MALKVLSTLDAARTQYYHFKAIIIAGMGLFTDAYDFFCIIPVMKLIGRIYYHDPAEHQKLPFVVTMVVAVAFIGTMIGQVVFGILGDRIGRKRVYGLALAVMVSSSIGCGFSICRTRKCMITSLCFFRFLLGVGIGGDYPLSATIMSEFANKVTRGSFIAAVFSMQGFGILVSAAVTMAVLAIFDRTSSASKDRTPEVADLAWRLILMFGAIPAALTYYWRMMMPETARYTALVEQNIRKAVKDMGKVLDVPVNQMEEEFEVLPNPPSYRLISKQFFRLHGRDLFACTTAWFLVDIAFYSLNLFQSKIYKQYLPNRTSVNAYQEAFHVARFQAIIAVCSTIPGYWVTVFFIDRIGRAKIQILGFFCMAICLFAIAVPYNKYWDKHTNMGFLVLYGLILFFANFGPNTTTFIVPAELFPARFRSTCHGISGAAGKLGAIIGSVGFLWASQDGNDPEYGKYKGIGMTSSMMILGGTCFMGAIFTYLFTPETMRRSLEDNENAQRTNSSELSHPRPGSTVAQNEEVDEMLNASILFIPIS